MKIAVCCSSSNDIDKKYMESSKIILEQIFMQGNDLVFGASNSGIMGIAYKIAKQLNRNVIGITTERYKDDLKDLDCDIEILTKNVTERTKEIINNSDLLLFLPGGIGTLCEFITSIEMKRNEEFDKPIIICNDTGYFDELLQMLNKVYEKNFTGENVRLSYNIANSYKDVIDLINKYRLN